MLIAVVQRCSCRVAGARPSLLSLASSPVCISSSSASAVVPTGPVHGAAAIAGRSHCRSLSSAATCAMQSPPPAAANPSMQHANAAGADTPAAFRAAMRSVASPVVVLTAGNRRAKTPIYRGLTCGSLTSVSLQPPIVAFSIRRGSSMSEMISRTGRCVVNVLSATQTPLAALFAYNVDDVETAQNLWKRVKHSTTEFGTPMLDGCLATIECAVHATIDVGDHSLWMMRVVESYSGAPEKTAAAAAAEEDLLAARGLVYVDRQFSIPASDNVACTLISRAINHQWTLAHHTQRLRQLWEQGRQKDVLLGSASPSVCPHATLEAAYAVLFRESFERSRLHASAEIPALPLEDAEEVDSQGASTAQPALDSSVDGHSAALESFDSFLALHAHLTDPSFVFRFYSYECLAQPDAKTTIVAPDLRPFPSVSNS
ncbi:hypothetical protein CAOG_04532 [Capsaspora owczarzaki ATCC 30864]|uniref:Flavin reductase like domain-containing protein n=1 Tax=Capsaspora owczarzaki (strain ATCC 30864) TaxID=595528 RepID=A0A0D2WRF0_CAPO3|nr:hypothetical protein CAOG_04532 [Capsaspora owczarzaki ATCC 30864]KJE93788.1 hypothetical protein CAOG_004532 [Capsaspora owczarzaki ATCC 30864]|eukprot:XP_004347279.1 hypothetical protein CAOG_04532 [Capsaspora owczarzaki ATCC 30864]